MQPDPWNDPFGPPPPQKPQISTGLLFTIIIAGFVCLFAGSITIISVISGMGPMLRQQAATAQAGQMATVAPTATAVALSTQAAQAALPADASPVFVEAFNDNKNDWEDNVHLDPPATTKGFVQDGQYTFGVTGDTNYLSLWSIPDRGRMPASFYLRVDAMQTAGEPDSSCGLLFNWSLDGKNWVVFQVAENGYFRVRRNHDGDASTLSPWTKLNAIQQGGWNRLVVRAQNDHYQFFVNQALAYETDDIGTPTGASGLMIAAADATEQTFRFDNFSMYSLGN